MPLPSQQRVSAIVPARNEEVNIARVVRSLSKQEDLLEILAVDDQSTDRTAEFLAALQGAAVARPAVAETTVMASPLPADFNPFRPPTGTIIGKQESQQSMAPISSSQAPQSGSGVQSLPLEDVTRKLAVYIGPVAKFVVKKLAAQTADLDAIYREAARQIPSETDRVKFLRSKGQ